MNPEFPGNLPILGSQQQKIRATIGPPISLIRDLDESGTFEPEHALQTTEGVQITVGRSNVVTAVDLVDMIIDALVPQLKVLIRQELTKEH